LKKKLVVAAVVAAGLIALFIWKGRPEPVIVAAVQIDEGAVEETVANTRAGTVKACRRSKLSMPVGGVVDRLLVKEGDKVKTGQLMLSLWNRDREAGVAQAQAALASAESQSAQACVVAERAAREADRLQTLLSRQLVSIDAADTAQSNARAQQKACRAAQSQVQAARSQLELQQSVYGRTELVAPFDGVVAEINGELGEYVTPSPPGVATPPAVDLIDTSCLYVTAPIDEVDAANLKLGLPVRITLDAFRGREFPGHLTRIAPYVLDLEKQARTVDVDVRFDTVPEDVALLVGYSADVTILLRRIERTLRVPTEALVAGNKVWVLEDDHLRSRTLKTGAGNWSWTAIESGLQAGEWVVRSPDQPGIVEGARARPRTDADERTSE
jgi:HlyD family secretion protein